MRTSIIIALGVTVLSTAGCSSWDTSEVFRERVDISADDLESPAATEATVEKIPVDLAIEGYEVETAPLLDAIVRGLEHHPGLEVGTVDRHPSRVEGLLRVSCHAECSASAWNGLIAFPGMFPFLPVWLGYGWDMKLTVAWTLPSGRTGARDVLVSFREKNARRSALFHLWPSSGFFGTQFVIGLVLAPTFWSYDAGATTPLLVRALEPRLGWTIAEAVRRDLAAEPSAALVHR